MNCEFKILANELFIMFFSPYLYLYMIIYVYNLCDIL